MLHQVYKMARRPLGLLLGLVVLLHLQPRPGGAAPHHSWCTDEAKALANRLDLHHATKRHPRTAGAFGFEVMATLARKLAASKCRGTDNAHRFPFDYLEGSNQTATTATGTATGTATATATVTADGGSGSADPRRLAGWSRKRPTSALGHKRQASPPALDPEHEITRVDMWDRPSKPRVM